MANDHVSAVLLSDGSVVRGFQVDAYPMAHGRSFVLEAQITRHFDNGRIELTREGVRAAIDVLTNALEDWDE